MNQDKLDGGSLRGCEGQFGCTNPDPKRSLTLKSDANDRLIEMLFQDQQRILIPKHFPCVDKSDTRTS